MAAQAWIRVWWYGRQKQGEVLFRRCWPEPTLMPTIDASVYLVLAISVLERVLKDSPANGQARMLLIKLYRLIG